MQNCEEISHLQEDGYIHTLAVLKLHQYRLRNRTVADVDVADRIWEEIYHRCPQTLHGRPFVRTLSTEDSH